MSAFHRGMVLMVKLAFSSQTGFKRRPVLVLRDAGDNDLLVVPVTSQPRRVAWDVELKDWQSAGLKLLSIVRTEKLATIEKSTVINSMGSVSDRDWDEVTLAVKGILTEVIEQ